MSATTREKFADWLKFETFGDSELVRVVEACRAWAGALTRKEEPRWLSLVGSCGTGKTHCALRLWQWAYVISRRDNSKAWAGCRYQPHSIYWPDFIQRLRAGEWFGVRNDMKDWPVLFLDDIGAERDPSGFAAEELNTLLGCRVGKWTLITSNLQMKALEQIDRRIASRLIRGKNVCVGLTTKDYSTR